MLWPFLPLEQDFLDEIKPLLLQSKKEKAAIEEVWKMLSAQLLEEGDSPSSLYGTPSLVRGMKLKAFYKVDACMCAD